MHSSVDSQRDEPGRDAPPDDETVRLIRERNTSTPQFHLYLTEETDAAGIDVGDTVAWDVLPPETPDEPPMLVCQRVPDSEAEMVPTARTVSQQGTAVHVGVATDVLGRERNLPGEPPVALGLDVPNYDPDNVLHFQPLVDEGVVALVPVGYDDGRAFRFDVEQGIGYPVGRVPESDERTSTTADVDADADSPIPEHIVDTVCSATHDTTVDSETLRDALDVVAGRLSPDSLPHVPEYDPLETDAGTVYVVVPDEFDRILLDILDSSDLADAVRAAHRYHAEDCIMQAGASDYRDATRDHATAVLTVSQK